MSKDQLLEQLQNLMKQKKSRKFYAERLGITEGEVKDLLQELKGEVEPEAFEGEIFTKVNTEKGTYESTLVSNFDPKSHEELIALHKIDTTKYKLSSYWSKQRGEKFTSSVNCTIKKPTEVTNEELKETLNEVFTDKNFAPFKIVKSGSNEKALCIYTSDKHVGAFTKDNSPYSNKYDALEFRVRLMSIFLEVQYLTSVYGKFEDIFVMDLGDSLDGFNGYTTRGGHKLPQNQTNKEAFNTYVQGHKEFFDSLMTSECANNYHFIVQSEDNHGGDFAYATNQAVIIYLNAKYPEVHTEIFDKFMDHFVYGDHTFILCHGKDSEDMKHGLPLYMNDKTENYINKYIDYHQIKSPNIHLIKGDLHQDTFQDTYKFRYRNTLSLYGMSKWIANNFGPNKAGCSFDVIEKTSNRVFPHRIFF